MPYDTTSTRPSSSGMRLFDLTRIVDMAYLHGWHVRTHQFHLVSCTELTRVVKLHVFFPLLSGVLRGPPNLDLLVGY